jgi:P pilus assembly chaperone PapD
MKRLTMLAAVLLTFAAVSFALAAAGPGKFETKLTGKGANTEHGDLDGTWTIDLANPTSGHLKLTVNGHQKGGGKYTISGTTITLTPKKAGTCKTTAKYTFTLSGNTLKFTPINDTCAVRRDVLTHGPWTKIG